MDREGICEELANGLKRIFLVYQQRQHPLRLNYSPQENSFSISEKYKIDEEKLG